VTRILVTGGVAANSRLRAAFESAANEERWTLLRADRRWCTDNAAMIGYVAVQRIRRGERSPLDVDANPGMHL
jgi:N6-L-threonylcarbamoyladenine synthase